MLPSLKSRIDFDMTSCICNITIGSSCEAGLGG
jgi:hypothetical protein